jgi:hypothetical protein
VPFLDGWGSANKGDAELFRRWAMPFAPLDLQVGNASHDEANDLRNFYLGIAGAAFGVDSRKLPDEFHCGKECVESRKSDLEGKLPRLRALVGDFRQLEGVDLLSIWGMGDDFRVNNLFRIMGRQRATSASDLMGFVPSGHWTPVEDADQYIAGFGGSSDAVRKVLQQMRSESVAALVRGPGASVRLVRIGIGDNESGLLFLESGSPTYSVGEKLPDGREIVFVVRLAPDVLFYESS